MNLKKALNLKDDEPVLYLMHQFPLRYGVSMAMVFILLILPFFFLFPLFELGVLGVVIFCVFIVGGAVYGLRQTVKWYYNVFAVTDRRVIDIDQRGFFDRTVSPVPREGIQGVSFRQKGLWQAIFKYGTVIIEMSQSSAKIEVRGVRHPHVLVQLIDEIRLRAPAVEDEPDDKKTKIIKDFAQDYSADDVEGLIKKLKTQQRDEVILDLYKEKDDKETD